VAFSIDTATPFGARAAGRLAAEPVAWLVTVNAHGQPQPNPVWYLWEGTGALIYSQPDTPKLRNIAANPRVALHLDTRDGGDDVVILSGVARTVPDQPPADRVPDYIAKYARGIANLDLTPEGFAAEYSVPVRFEARRIRGF
jgi:PPOX class probable F420-dependent enzyme